VYLVHCTIGIWSSALAMVPGVSAVTSQRVSACEGGEYAGLRFPPHKAEKSARAFPEPKVQVHNVP